MQNLKAFNEFYRASATLEISEPFYFKHFTDGEETYTKADFWESIMPSEHEGIISDDDHAEIVDGVLQLNFSYFPESLSQEFITNWITDNLIRYAKEDGNYSELFEVNDGEPLIIVADYNGVETEF